MSDQLLTKLLDTVIDMKEDVATIKERQEITIHNYEETSKTLVDMNIRLSKVENKVEDAAKTWKITKRVVLGLGGIVISLLTFNWAGLAKAWALILHV